MDSVPKEQCVRSAPVTGRFCLLVASLPESGSYWIPGHSSDRQPQAGTSPSREGNCCFANPITLHIKHQERVEGGKSSLLLSLRHNQR